MSNIWCPFNVIPRCMAISKQPEFTKPHIHKLSLCMPYKNKYNLLVTYLRIYYLRWCTYIAHRMRTNSKQTCLSTASTFANNYCRSKPSHSDIAGAGRWLEALGVNCPCRQNWCSYKYIYTLTLRVLWFWYSEIYIGPPKTNCRVMHVCLCLIKSTLSVCCCVCKHETNNWLLLLLLRLVAGSFVHCVKTSFCCRQSAARTVKTKWRTRQSN